MGFFDSFFGKDQEEDIKRAKKKSDKALDSGYQGANSYYDQGYDQLNPYAQQGTQANSLYGQAIGLGTDEERAAAQMRYFTDPAFQSVLGQQSNALLRNLNARGQSGGGKAMMAAGRLGTENYNNWLNRLQQQGQQGGQFASQQSNIRLGQGDLRYGYGATKAGNEINYGNAMAANRNTGINNLLNLGGTVAKGVSAAASAGAFSDIRLKRDVQAIGETPAGLPVYRFKYIFSASPQIGVMAHEVMELFPEAVRTHPSGYLMVDYSLIS